MSSGNIIQIAEKTVHIEWSYRSSQLTHRFETDIQGLVCCKFILVIFSSPVTFPVQTYIPVAEVFSYKILYCTSCPGQVIIIITISNLFNKRVKQGDYPAVYLRSFINRDLFLGISEIINICIKRKEGIGII